MQAIFNNSFAYVLVNSDLSKTKKNKQTKKKQAIKCLLKQSSIDARCDEGISLLTKQRGISLWLPMTNIVRESIS